VKILTIFTHSGYSQIEGSLHFRSKYPPQHTVLRNPESMFVPELHMLMQ